MKYSLHKECQPSEMSLYIIRQIAYNYKKLSNLIAKEYVGLPIGIA